MGPIRSLLRCSSFLLRFVRSCGRRCDGLRLTGGHEEVGQRRQLSGSIEEGDGVGPVAVQMREKLEPEIHCDYRVCDLFRGSQTRQR